MKLDLDNLNNHIEFLHNTDPFDKDTDDDFLGDYLEIMGIYSPSNPGANASGYVHTNPTNPDSDGDTYIDSVEINMNSNPNDPLSFPEQTITITQNETITVTVETGIIFSSIIITTIIGITVLVLLLRKRRK